MTIKRNTDGLRQNAQKKRQEAFEKVEKGIQQLIKEGRRINFNTVVEASGVSKAWLYKQPEIKARIEQLRSQSGSKKKLPPQQRASDASKDNVIKTLKGRIKRLEADNKDLRKQNEVAYGHMIKVRELEQRIRRLEAENERLRHQSVKPLENAPDGSNPDLVSIWTELEELGVELNSTLEKSIKQTPQAIVETAIGSLKEAMNANRAQNPGGFLYKAITDAWKPTEIFQRKANMEEFNEWWKWAYKEGLVKAATQFDGVQHVLTTEEEWLPFSEAARIMSKE